MDLKKLLNDVKDSNIEIEDALEKLKDLPFEDIGYAHIDHHRSIRNGYPEVIYCKGKSDDHILGIIERMNEKVVIFLEQDAKRLLMIKSLKYILMQNMMNYQKY